MRKRSGSRASRRNRSRQPSAGLDFHVLEPRQLLAGDVAGTHQIEFELPTGINLVANGDFESFTAGDDNFYTQSEVAGWQSKEAGTAELLNLINSSGNGMVLDLDSTASHFDRVYQDVTTIPGKNYLITFDFRAHPVENTRPTTPNTNDFEVWWNGQQVAVYSAGDHWQTGSLLVNADSTTTELLFCEIFEGDVNGGGDAMGALLDNIRVMEAVESPITNGSFESMSPDRTHFFRPFQVDGWGAMGADLQTRLIKIEDLATGAASGASDGDFYLNLDSTQAQRDVVFQDFDTVVGATYYVSFDLKVDGPQDNNTDELRVRWNNQWATTLHGSTEWQTYGIMLEADSDISRLTFLEPGDGNNGDGSGPLIDSVQLFRVDPAGVNEAPVIDQIQNQTVDFGCAVTFDVTADDPENHVVSFVLDTNGIAAGHNLPTISETGRISWTPSDAGPVEMTVTAIDQLGKTDTMTFTATVDEFVAYEGVGALSGVPPIFRDKIYASAGAPDIKIDTTKNFEARFTTTEGTFSVTLDPVNSPQTVNNFVLLARDGFYDGLEFHRVIEGFMSQGGDPLGTGRGGPGYTFADEVSNGLTFSEPLLLAMANAGPNTNGSQFFITFDETENLNGRHTIFGKIEGDSSAFLNNVITHTTELVGGQAVEVPIPGIEKTKIESITIHVT